VTSRFPRKMIAVHPSVHGRLIQVQAELEEDVEHPVTISEAIETLLADRAQLLTLLEQR
jgi:hypothetical protein